MTWLTLWICGAIALMKRADHWFMQLASKYPFASSFSACSVRARTAAMSGSAAKYSASGMPISHLGKIRLISGTISHHLAAKFSGVLNSLSYMDLPAQYGSLPSSKPATTSSNPLSTIHCT